MSKPSVDRPQHRLGIFSTCMRVAVSCGENRLKAGLALLAAAASILAVVASIAYFRASAALWEAQEEAAEDRASLTELAAWTDRALAKRAGMQPVRRELLQKVIALHEKSLAEGGADKTTRGALAAVCFRLGALFESTASFEEAMAEHQRAYVMRKALASERPHDVDCKAGLGDSLNAIARVLLRQGRRDEAMVRQRQALRVREQVVAADPKHVDHRRKLANAHMNLGIVLGRTGAEKRARSECDEAQRIRRDIAGKHPLDRSVQVDLAKGHYNVALSDLTAFDGAAARQSLGEAVSIFEDLLEDDPQDIEIQYGLALCLAAMGDVLAAGEFSPGEDSDAADASYRRAADMLKRLVDENPSVHKYEASRAAVLMRRGGLRGLQHDYEEAVGLLTSACRRLQKLVGRYPNIPRYRRDLALGFGGLAALREHTDETRPRHADLESALRHFEFLLKQFPDDAEFQAEAAALRDLVEEVEELDSIERRESDSSGGSANEGQRREEGD